MIVLGVDPGSQRTGWGVVARRGHELVAEIDEELEKVQHILAEIGTGGDCEGEK